MASQIADHLALKIENLTSPNINGSPGGDLVKRGRGRPRKDDKDPKPHTSTAGQKSYPCDWPHCGMWFSQSSNLNKHYLTHTNEKPFKCLCPNCNKSFKQSSNLNKHRFVHTGEKPFACDQCDKKFSQSSNLKKHKMVHSGEKPYHCHIPGCSKVFDQSSNLNKHLLTHMGQKPYNCNECGEKFSQSSNLAKHMRKHGQYNFKLDSNNSNENITLSGEVTDSRLMPSVLQANCYSNGTTHTVNGNNNNLPPDLTNVQKIGANSAAAAMTAAVAANAFFTNHTKLINSFDTLDPKFISAHNFLNPAISLPSTFAHPVTSSATSSRLASDHFQNGTSENGLEMTNSPDDPNRFLSLKLSVNNSED